MASNTKVPLSRQVHTLVGKNIRLALFRHSLSTVVRAFLLPVILTAFLAYTRNLFIPKAYYGIGSAQTVRSLPDALDLAKAGRNKVVFVNNGFENGDISQIISRVAEPIRSAGKAVDIVARPDDLLDVCPSSLRGVSSCFAAAVFYASPTEGNGGIWNYTLRADGGLSISNDVRKSTNDAEIYVIPLQRAIDRAIAAQNTTLNRAALADTILEFPFTSKSEEERKTEIRVRYQNTLIKILSVAYFVAMVMIMYHVAGAVAAERESGMSQLIESMMPNSRRWQPQFARLVSFHLGYDVLYIPGWVVIAIVLKVGVLAKTSAAILIIYHIHSGLALCSFAIFGAVFFKKTQLSGITVTIVTLLLGIVSQVLWNSSTAAVAILSFIFPPMNAIFFTMFIARFEQQDVGANIIKNPPNSSWNLPGIVLWIFTILQIFWYMALAAYVERMLHGTTSQGRTVNSNLSDDDFAIKLRGFTKTWQPSWFSRTLRARFGKPPEAVMAVKNLTLSAVRGQIFCLLGANGSGKSTTLDAICGLNTVTSGTIEVNGQGGLGLCPQKNVLWNDLTAFEHAKIFNRLKTPGKKSSHAEVLELLGSCDLQRKVKAQAKTLSGGQKRKLQLVMMLTGGSKVCCVDEVSSGLDPISRRKIWDILLAERGARTILLTTHFLDEADLLADHIAILSKGFLKVEGSSVELKHRLGGGYRVSIPAGQDPALNGILPFQAQHAQRHVGESHVFYTTPGSAEASELIRGLERSGVRDYQISGPTIEDVFLKVADEVKNEHDTQAMAVEKSISNQDEPVKGDVIETPKPALQLVTGKRLSMPKQAWVLFRKRWTVLKHNYLPYYAAVIVPIVAAGLVTLFLKNYTPTGCDPAKSTGSYDIQSLSYSDKIDMVAGPASKFSPQSLALYQASLPGASGGQSSANASSLQNGIRLVNSLQEFNDYVNIHHVNITPGGFYLGEGSSATFAWRGELGVYSPVVVQNAMDVIMSNLSISSQYQAFNVPWGISTGSSLQLIVYLGLAFSAFPAFFALYPTVERLRNIRALQYSNGVRALPLWLAYLCFDGCFIIFISAIATAVLAGSSSSAWYYVGYLFVIFWLYGTASILLSYVISLFCTSQLSAFAVAAGLQASMFLIYFIGYLSILTYAPTQSIDNDLSIFHFTYGAFSPAANLIRGLFVALNLFSITCKGKELAPYPGAITLYGGPILYLIIQSLVLFAFLVWWDASSLLGRVGRSFKKRDAEQTATLEKEVSDELMRVTSNSNDGLRVIHLKKRFKDNIAVDDLTFGVRRGEVFALLGPNGAGKSTTISLIRGDIQPSRNGGEVFVENISVSKNRAAARAHLGVCPQFDAMDTMTALDQLKFYARIRGVADVEHNTQAVIRAVGLEAFSGRMAAKLSGGNKRKLSLGVALMGNPTVLLLDEPSSGMDAAAKRVMWKTLASVVPGRSLVLTTHSMEEADALADRAGIMAGKMLALGTSESLRQQHGNAYHVHLMTATAPHTSDEEMGRIRDWILERFPGAMVEEKTYHGQLRFSLPAGSRQQRESTRPSSSRGGDEGIDGTPPSGQGISALFEQLEDAKEMLRLEYYSVSQTTLDQVFLSIVGKHAIEEENNAEPKSRGWVRKAFCLGC